GRAGGPPAGPAWGAPPPALRGGVPASPVPGPGPPAAAPTASAPTLTTISRVRRLSARHQVMPSPLRRPVRGRRYARLPAGLVAGPGHRLVRAAHRDQAVPGPADRLQPFPAELAPQVADVHLDRVRRRLHRRVP